MESILIHVSEFGSWVASSRLNIDLQRVIGMKGGDLNSFHQLLNAFGNVRISEPEAYILVKLKGGWRQSISRSTNSLMASKASLDLDSVFSFQALTQDAQLRLHSQTERLSIKLSPPEFENQWREFQSYSQLQEARESGAAFLSLYSFMGKIQPEILDISDSLLAGLLTRITDYKSERKLESLKGMAEYGPTEFGMRISVAFDDEWRKNEERYVRFRQVRSVNLSDKSWNDISFLDFHDFCESLVSFDEESRNILGLPPLAAVAFFKINAEYTLQGKKLNYEAVKKNASKMYDMGNHEDCFNFLYIIGCSIGLEQVASIKYRVRKESYSVFNVTQLSESYQALDSDLFLISQSQDAAAVSILDNVGNLQGDSKSVPISEEGGGIVIADKVYSGEKITIENERIIPPLRATDQQELIPPFKGLDLEVSHRKTPLSSENELQTLNNDANINTSLEGPPKAKPKSSKKLSTKPKKTSQPKNQLT